jgi:hypothetical protein
MNQNIHVIAFERLPDEDPHQFELVRLRRSPNGSPTPTFPCPSAGFFPAPGSCTKFIRCVDFYGTGRRFTTFEFSCGPGTVYDQRILGCNHPRAVPGLSCAPGELQAGTPQQQYGRGGITSSSQGQGHGHGQGHQRQQPWYKTNQKPPMPVQGMRHPFPASNPAGSYPERTHGHGQHAGYQGQGQRPGASYGPPPRQQPVVNGYRGTKPVAQHQQGVNRQR